jgi:hemerythrin-like metal-binding protein
MAHHFLEEDAVLAAARHPAAEKHAAEHRQLVSSLTALVQQFRAGVSGMDHLVRFVCQEVVLNHIEGADRELEFRPQPVVAA